MSIAPVSVKHNCSIMSSAQLPLFGGVPTEFSVSPYLVIKYSVPRDQGPRTLRGHASRMTEPLPRPGLLFKRWDEVRDILSDLLGNNLRADMARKVIQLQMLCGSAFPSARRLAKEARCNEKTWDRCLEELRRRGLADTMRTHRADGNLSVNLIDLRKLWAIILRMITAIKSRFQLVTGRLWVKLHGAWIQVQQLPLPVGPSS